MNDELKLELLDRLKAIEKRLDALADEQSRLKIGLCKITYALETILAPSANVDV